MWALKPTIMELLSEHLIPNEEILPSLSPAIQLTILTIMNSHCTRYIHFKFFTVLFEVIQFLILFLRYSSFLSSSSLVKSGSPHFSQESSSPSTGYFTLILKILTDTLSNVININ
jgi:Serine/threonine-protein kinase smg-1